MTASALEERRRIIIRMKESGYREDEIVAATGCSRQVIYPLWDKYKRCKDDVFQVQARGNKFGNGRTLTEKQEKRMNYRRALPCGIDKYFCCLIDVTCSVLPKYADCSQYQDAV